MLTATRCLGYVNGWYTWMTICDCGEEKAFTARNLQRARSCGCLDMRKTMNKDAGILYMQKVLERYSTHSMKCPKYRITGAKDEKGNVFGVCNNCGHRIEEYINLNRDGYKN